MAHRTGDAERLGRLGTRRRRANPSPVVRAAQAGSRSGRRPGRCPSPRPAARDRRRRRRTAAGRCSSAGSVASGHRRRHPVHRRMLAVAPQQDGRGRVIRRRARAGQRLAQAAAAGSLSAVDLIRRKTARCETTCASALPTTGVAGTRPTPSTAFAQRVRSAPPAPPRAIAPGGDTTVTTATTSAKRPATAIGTSTRRDRNDIATHTTPSPHPVREAPTSVRAPGTGSPTLSARE